MYYAPTSELLDHLRGTLRVMEERSHLGLDNGAADKLRQILERRIERLETQLAAASNRAGFNLGTMAATRESQLLDG
jgi:hypothetical protein